MKSRTHTHTHTHTHVENKLISIWISFIFFLFLSTNVIAQEVPSSGVNGTGAFIEVSDDLYQVIKDWLLFGSKEQKLDDFLLKQHTNEKEVLDFLGAYYSGSTSFNANKTTTGQSCVCNVIRPSTIPFDKEIEADVDKWIKIDDNSAEYEWYKQSDGMYKRAGLKIAGSQGTHQQQTQTNYAKYEVLNLCTYAGAPQTECNCNKPMRISGEYSVYWDIEAGHSGSGLCLVCSHGREGQFADIFYVTHFDLEPSSSATIWVAPEITVSYSRKFEEEFDFWATPVKFDALLEAGGALANLLVPNLGITTTIKDITNPSSISSTTVQNPTSPTGITALTQALANIPGGSGGNNLSHKDHLEQVPFDGSVILKANTPKIIFYSTYYKSRLRAYGPNFRDIRIENQSFFRTTHVVDHHPQSYDQNGDLIGLDWNCCNELYGWWYNTPVTLPGWSQYSYTLNDIQRDVMNDLNYGLLRDWSYSSLINGNPNATTADVDLNNLINYGHPPISGLNDYVGEVGSIEKCGCEGLYSQAPVTGKLLQAILYSKDECIWLNSGTTVTILDQSFPSAKVNQGLINTYWLYNGAQLNIPGLPLGVPNTAQVTVDKAGLYALVYEDANSVLCQTVAFFNLPACIGKTDGNNFKRKVSGLKVKPNPASSSISLTFEGEIGNLNIYDSSGKVIYSSFEFRSDQSIDISDWPNGLYHVTLNNEKTSGYEKISVSH